MTSTTSPSSSSATVPPVPSSMAPVNYSTTNGSASAPPNQLKNYALKLSAAMVFINLSLGVMPINPPLRDPHEQSSHHPVSPIVLPCFLNKCAQKWLHVTTSRMPDFQKLFMENNGDPIVYKGEKLCLDDSYPVAKGDRVSILIESTGDSFCRQGVGVYTKAKVRYRDEIIPSCFSIWQDDEISSFEVVIDKIQGEKGLVVYNICDPGDGSIHCCHSGAAMIVEYFENGRRYRCNDARADHEKFNDIIFSVETLGS